MTAPLLIAHLTDTHVVADGTDEELQVDNNARLREAVSRIVAEAPSVAAVLATGDLVNDARSAEYEALVTLLAALPVPVLPIPGNHDDRDLVRAAFPDTPWVDSWHASWVTVVGGARLIGLDSTIPGEPGAAFDAEREGWLRSVLAEPHDDGPTLLAIHHPPFLTGIGWMDRSGFAGLDRLTAVLSDHPVERIVCGHLHRPISSSIAGIPANVGLSTVEHVELDLAADARASLILDPVGYHVLRISGRDVVVHTRYIATDHQRFVPAWAAEFD